jgi:hypothetical protein
MDRHAKAQMNGATLYTAVVSLYVCCRTVRAQLQAYGDLP